MAIIKTVFGVINQRHFLATMCMWGFAMNTLNQLNFFSMMTEVLYKGHDIDMFPTKEKSGERRTSECPPLNHTVTTPIVQEFIWGKVMQIHILMGYQAGYALGRLPAGLAVDRIGLKTVYGFGVFMPGILSMLTPICARTSPYVLIVNRILCGFFSTVQTPAMAYLAARWFPRKNVGFMLAWIYLGFPLGCVFSYSIGHQLLYVFQKWTSMFYINGFLSVFWAYIWQAVVWDDPFDHPYISEKELELLKKEIPMYADNHNVQPGSSWPWHSICTSSALWTLTLANIGYTWYYYFVTAIIPSLYLAEVNKINTNDHENVMTFMSVMAGLAILVTGMVTDSLVNSRMLTVTHLTKGRFALSNVVGSVLLMGLTHSRCFFTTIFLHLIVAILLLGVGFTCHIHACLNISSENVGVIVALTSIPSDVTSPLEVKLADELTPNGRVEEWRLVSYVYCVLISFLTTIFLKWGNCQPQSFIKPKRIQRRNSSAKKTGLPGDVTVKDVKNPKEPIDSSSKSNMSSVLEAGDQSAADDDSIKEQANNTGEMSVTPKTESQLKTPKNQP